MELAPNALKKNKYLAGTDKERLNDLVSALTDDEIRAVICSRGGYGSVRILEGIPWEELASTEPKPFVGFSDINAIMLNLLNRAGWITFAGLQAGKALGSAVTDRTFGHFIGMLDGSCRRLEWAGGEAIHLKNVRGGWVEGNSIPCCLSILASLAGTEFFPNLDNTILCLEDLNEPPYRIDRMFQQLRMTGCLRNISGLVLGSFIWQDEDISEEAAEIVCEIFKSELFPIWKDLPFGHVSDRLTIPMGIPVSVSNAGLLQGSID